MNSEIGRYGYEGTVRPSYYRIRQWNPMFSSYQIMLVRIDEFGNDEFVGYRSLADGERIEDVATWTKQSGNTLPQRCEKLRLTRRSGLKTDRPRRSARAGPRADGSRHREILQRRRRD